MKHTPANGKILSQVKSPGIKLGDLRKIAQTIKKDQTLAMELWADGNLNARLLAMLIMDPKTLSQETIDLLGRDMQSHNQDDRVQLMDWLMANQLSKNKSTIALMTSWRDHPSPLLRRTFWYYQARLRWVGQAPPPNSEALLSFIEKNILKEVPEVQWAMNFTAAQIGIFQPEYRAWCIALGERTALYKEEIVAKNCTPNYLPQFIAIQVAKLKK